MNTKNIVSRSRFLFVVMLVAMTILSGCGGDAATAVPAATATSAPAVATATVAAPSTATSMPIIPTNTTAPLPTKTTAPLPTKTTAPLPTKTKAPLPTATSAMEPTETAAAEPTSGTGTSIGDLNTRLYDGAALEFNIAYPGDWEVSEVPDATNPDTDGQVNILRPGTDGNVGLVVISAKLASDLTSKDVLATVVDSVVNNADYSNVQSSSTSMFVGNAATDAAHLEYDWSGLHMITDATALVQGDRAYTILAVAPDTDYDANSALFADAFASFQPLAAVADFETFTAKDGLVSIQKPKTWDADDTDPAFTVFAAPAGDALIIFSATDEKQVFNEEDFDAYIKQFLADNFETSDGYKFNATEVQTDGSVRVSFDITGPNQNTWLSNGFFEQRGTIVVFSLFSADEAKWEDYRDLFGTVANSIVIDETALNATKSIVTEDFAADNVPFTTLAPKGWVQQAQDDGTVVYWNSPDSDGSIVIQVAAAEGLDSTYFNEAQNAIDYITAIYGEDPDFAIVTTELQSDNSMRVDWTLTGVNGNPWQGSGFLDVREDKIVAQLVSADTAVWEQYLTGFNDIINSLVLK